MLSHGVRRADGVVLVWLAVVFLVLPARALRAQLLFIWTPVGTVQSERSAGAQLMVHSCCN